MHVYTIAEAAATHDGSLEKAYRLIDQARDIGADACKFQWTSSPEKLAERRHAPEYLKSYKLLSFPVIWHASLAKYCEGYGIDYLCTVYLPEDLRIIAPYVKYFKISSFEALDVEFVGTALEMGQVIISLGMGAISLLGNWRTKYLHCVSAYPTPDKEINLLRILECHGLSDHTKNPLTGALAVALGAEIIEFHMRLWDTDRDNADYEVSRDPLQAAEYVKNIRLAEVMLGDGIKKVQDSEQAMLKYRVSPQRPGAGG